MGVSLHTSGIGNTFPMAMRHQIALTGGGNKSVQASGRSITWTERFIAISQGKGTGAGLTGFFQIDMPPDGTVIQGVGGAANQTVTGGRIPMEGWSALFYILPVGMSNVSRPENFRFVQYASPSTQVTIPDDWVLICVENSDARSSSHKWGTGEFDDGWRNLTLLAGWVKYGGSVYATPAYRKVGNMVEIKGLMSSGSVATQTRIAVLPEGFRPSEMRLFTVVSHTGAAYVNARLDVHSNGDITMENMGNGFTSLDGVLFRAEN